MRKNSLRLNAVRLALFLLGVQLLACALAATVSVGTNKGTYYRGETVVISGTASPYISGAGVGIEVRDPNNDVKVSTSIYPSSSGSYSYSYQLPGDATTGTWKVYVTYADASGSTTFRVSPPDFSISVSPSSRTITQGQSTTYTVTLTSLGGFSSSVSLGVSGLSSGATASFSPSSVTPTGSSTLKISTTETAQTGTFTLTITATGGGITHTATTSLTINAIPPDFSISISPSSLSVVVGSSGSATVTVTSQHGFSSSVSLSASAPSGVSCSLNPQSVTPPSGGSASSTLTVSVSSSAPPGSYSIAVTGSSGPLSHSTTFTLTIVSPDFSLTVDRTSVGLVIGERPQDVKFTVKSIGGFAATISLNITDVPGGVLATLDRTSVSLEAGGQVSGTLSTYASWNSAPGNYTIKLKGSGGGKEHVVGIALNVVLPPPSFNLTVQPIEATLPKVEGYNFSLKLILVSSTNYSVVVPLDVQGVPSGISATLGSQELRCERMGLNSTTLVLVVGKELPAEGNYTITVTGRSGASESRATLALRVITKVPSSISASLNTTSIEYGRGFGIEGMISPPQMGEVMIHAIFANGSEVAIGRVQSDDQGRYSYSFTPEWVGSFSVVVSWEGSALYLGASSKPLGAEVKRATTELSLGLNASKISPGEKALASGALRTSDGEPLAEMPVTLTVEFGETAFSLKALTNQSGGYSVTLPFLGNGTYSLVASFDGDRRYMPSCSGEATLSVAQPPEPFLTPGKLAFTAVGLAVGFTSGFLAGKLHKPRREQ
jgi:hypothetical protein